MRAHERLRVAAAVGVCACSCGHATAAAIDDDMAGPSAAWQITSGELTYDEGVARSDSAVFRMNSVDRSFGNATVSVRLAVDSMERGPDWSGAHVWVRYQSQYELYAVSVDREDGTMIIKKKCAGGADNGGTYYNLTDYQPAEVPYGDWQDVVVTATDLPDGSVKIDGSRDGYRLSAVDRGVGCAPLRGGGVGVRGDNSTIRLDRIAVQHNE